MRRYGLVGIRLGDVLLVDQFQKARQYLNQQSLTKDKSATALLLPAWAADHDPGFASRVGKEIQSQGLNLCSARVQRLAGLFRFRIFAY
jgi:hypothetical protein